MPRSTMNPGGSRQKAAFCAVLLNSPSCTSWLPGPDRRGGAWIDRQCWDVSSFTNVPIFMPYSYLMVYTYAGGTNYRNPWGEGALEDASSFGARLDYAVAANLNAFGTFFYADR